MPGILAIETATEACSVALSLRGEVVERHAVAPRDHSYLLPQFLEELVPGGDLAGLGVDAIAFGSGPGSFTGLRIAASAVQGLAFASGLPAVPVSTLEILAQTARAEGHVVEQCDVLCVMDARINEVYAGICRFQDNLARLVAGPWACSPEDIPAAFPEALVAVGNGCQFQARFPASLRARIIASHAALLPRARDMCAHAEAALARGQVQPPEGVQPVYVRDEINWKKIHEQGKAR